MFKDGLYPVKSRRVHHNYEWVQRNRLRVRELSELYPVYPVYPVVFGDLQPSSLLGAACLIFNSVVIISKWVQWVQWVQSE
jgi:hypothetical protein